MWFSDANSADNTFSIYALPRFVFVFSGCNMSYRNIHYKHFFPHLGQLQARMCRNFTDVDFLNIYCSAGWTKQPTSVEQPSCTASPWKTGICSVVCRRTVLHTCSWSHSNLDIFSGNCQWLLPLLSAIGCSSLKPPSHNMSDVLRFHTKATPAVPKEKKSVQQYIQSHMILEKGCYCIWCCEYIKTWKVWRSVIVL